MTIQTKAKTLGAFAIAMISVAGIINLRSLPMMASVGLNAVFFYLLAALVFLIPSALVCAELASHFPQAGGIYAWVKQAFGEKTGFFAMWSEWFNNVIGFPATASFIAIAILYLFKPALAQNKLLVLGLVLTILWGCTLYNFLGVVASSRLNILGALFGTIIPAIIIIALGATWLLLGKPAQIHFATDPIIPNLHITNLVFFTGVLSSYAGMQITAFHAPNVKNPQHNFPRAIGIAVVLIVVITLFSALAIAIVVPPTQIQLVSGVMEAFKDFLQAFKLTWAQPIIVLLIIISGISTLAAWLLGPARGLAVAAQYGDFPVYFGKESARGIPVRLLLLQVGIATLLAFLFVLLPNLNVAFWLLTVLTSQFTLIMYILLFSSATVLRKQVAANSADTFKIPGKGVGHWLISCIAIIVCVGAYILGFFPPAQLPIPNLWIYEGLIITGNLVYLILPILIYKKSKSALAK